MSKISLESLKEEMTGDLNRYNIHLLREQGLRLGVKSVTTHKKKKLVELIVEKKLQEHQPHRVDMSNEYGYEVSFDDKSMLMEMYRNPEICEGEVVSGVIEMGETIDAFLRVDGFRISNKDVFVPQGIVKEFGLRYGDNVVGKSARVSGKAFYGLINVLSINGQKTTGLVRADFSTLPPCQAKDKLSLAQKDNDILQYIDIFSPMAIGQRSLIFSKGMISYAGLLTKILRKLIDAGIKTSAMFLAEKPETIRQLKDEFGDAVVCTDSEASPRLNERVAHMTLEKLKREAETGKDTALIVGNLATLCNGGVGTAMSKEFNFRTLFGSGRRLENGGSLTIIGFGFLMGQMGESIFETLTPIANSVIMLQPNAVTGEAVYAQSQSFSDFFDCNENEREKLRATNDFVLSQNGKCTTSQIVDFYNTLQKK